MLPTLKSLVSRASILAAALSLRSVASAIPGETISWSNLDANNASSGIAGYVSGIQYVVVQSFTTGASATELGSILLDMESGSGSGFSLALYSAGVNAPGSLLETLSGSAAPTSAATYSFTSGLSIALSANTTYWWVASVESESLEGQFKIALTTFSSEANDGGWSIGQGYSTYPSDEGFGPLNPFRKKSFQFAVTTSAIPEPSTYAALAGFGAFAFVVWRRRACVRTAAASGQANSSGSDRGGRTEVLDSAWG